MHRRVAARTARRASQPAFHSGELAGVTCARLPAARESRSDEMLASGSAADSVAGPHVELQPIVDQISESSIHRVRRKRAVLQRSRRNPFTENRNARIECIPERDTHPTALAPAKSVVDSAR